MEKRKLKRNDSFPSKAFLSALQVAYDEKEESGLDKCKPHFSNELDRLEDVLLIAQTMGTCAGQN